MPLIPSQFSTFLNSRFQDNQPFFGSAASTRSKASIHFFFECPANWHHSVAFVLRVAQHTQYTLHYIAWNCDVPRLTLPGQRSICWQVAKCQEAGLGVILCIGETLDERHVAKVSREGESHETLQVVNVLVERPTCLVVRHGASTLICQWLLVILTLASMRIHVGLRDCVSGLASMVITWKRTAVFMKCTFVD